MYFLLRPIKHLAPIRRWVRAHGAEMALSADTFEMDIRLDEGQIKLAPRFVVGQEDALSHGSRLTVSWREGMTAPTLGAYATGVVAGAAG